MNAQNINAFVMAMNEKEPLDNNYKVDGFVLLGQVRVTCEECKETFKLYRREITSPAMKAGHEAELAATLKAILAHSHESGKPHPKWYSLDFPGNYLSKSKVVPNTVSVTKRN